MEFREHGMDPKINRSLFGPVKTVLFTVATLLSFLLTGCVWNYPWVRREPETRLSINPTKAELVGYLNANIERIQTWRSTNVRIMAKGPGVLSIPLSGTISVENPKKFRLTVESFGVREADLGSNSNRFWFWMRRSNIKEVITCRHDQIDQLQNSLPQNSLPIPFDPNWLMEALGVVPIDETAVTMLAPDPETGFISLVSEQAGPNDRPVRRVILVDPRKGEIVSQTLHNEFGKIIAQATFDEYRYDEQSGTSLPHRIELDLPEARMKMTLRFDQIEVNPANLPQQTWQMPSHLPVLDVGSQIPRVATADSEPPGRVRLGGSRGNPVRFAANNSPFKSVEAASPAYENQPQFDNPPRFDDPPQFDDVPQFEEDSSFYDVPQFDNRMEGRDLTDVPQFDNNFEINSTENFKAPIVVPERNQTTSRNGSVGPFKFPHSSEEPEWGDTPFPRRDAAGKSVDQSWWR